jgi:putative cell wall-binding protein
LSTRTKRTSKRSFAGLIAAALVASVLAIISSPAAATTAVTQKRLSGLDRYATAAAVAENAYASATKSIIVSGETYADALSASALSGAVSAPIFLTPASALPAVTAAAMARVMGANKTVYIIGGTNAVGAGVATTLTGLGYVVTRISGADRYATAAAVAAKVKTSATIGSMNGIVTCILVSGQGYADGLAAGPLAAGHKMPVLLTEPDTLTAATSAAITANGCKQMLIVGGTASVSAAVATAADALTGVSVTRVSGADRYATSVAVAELAYKVIGLGGLGWASVQTIVARGDSFADALAASQLAGTGTNRTLLLTQADAIPAGVSTLLTAKRATLDYIFVIGGTSAIPADVAQAADDAATIAKPTAVISGATVGSNAITITTSEKVTGGTTAANFKINNAAIPVATCAFASSAEAAAPYAGEATTFVVVADACPYAVGNKVLLAPAADPANFTEIVGNAAETGVVVDYPDATHITVAGVYTTATIAGTFAPAASASNAAGTVHTVYISTPLAAGDVITVTGVASAATSAAITAASATVAAAASTATPKGTLTCYTTGTATSYLTMDMPVKGLAIASIAETDASSIAAANIARIDGTNSYSLTWAAAPAAGSTITLDSSTLTGQNAKPGSTVDPSGTCANNTTKPVAQSASMVVTNSTQAGLAVDDGSGDTVQISFLKAGVAPGVLGNQYKVTTVDTGSASKTAFVVEYNSAAKAFVMSYDRGATGLAVTSTGVAAALNGNATFATMAVANVTVSNGGVWDETAGDEAIAGGVTSVAVAVTFNGGILWAVGDIDETSITLSGTTAANVTAATNNLGSPASNAAHFGGKATFTFALITTEYVNYPTAGSSTIAIGIGDVTSLQGNTTTAKQTVTIQ